MRTEAEIRAKIADIEKSYAHVLSGSLATMFENAPRAIMQIEATSTLSGLFYALGEKRPKYEFEKERGKL